MKGLHESVALFLWPAGFLALCLGGRIFERDKMLNPRRMISRASFVILTGLLGLPAIAQDFCGGVGAEGKWIGGTAEASDISVAGDHREQIALVLGSAPYIALFSLSAPMDVRLEAAGRAGSDTIIELFDSNGASLAFDDDSGGGFDSRLELPLSSGTYCLRVENYEDAPMSAFVRVGRLEHEPLTDGIASADNSSNSVAIGEGCGDGFSQELQLGLPGVGAVIDVPAWSFSLPVPTAVSITAENEDADPQITLYSADGAYIDENDDAVGLNSRLDVRQPLAAGEYCIEMQALSDEFAPVTVTVSEYDPDAAMMAMYDQGISAPPLDGSYPIVDLGVLQTRMRKDVQNTDTATWYTVTVEQTGLLLVEAISVNFEGDPEMRVFDDFGREIAYNDDFGSGYDSQIAVRLNAGTYMVALREVNTGAQAFTRLLMELFVPAQ